MISDNPLKFKEATGFWQTFEFFALDPRLNRVKFLGLYFIWSIVILFSSSLALLLPSYIQYLTLLLIFLFLMPNLLALLIRRFHDLNLSAWWIISLLIPFLGVLTALILVFMPGTKGDNKYGEMPEPALNRYYYITIICMCFILLSRWLR